MSTRDDCIAGLRELADRLEAHPAAPLSYHGGSVPALVFAHATDELVAAARCYGGSKVQGDKGIELHGTLAGFRFQVMPLGGAVCERVEVGTRKVTRTRVVKEAVIAKPAQVEEYEDEEPVYEIRCPDSILALADERSRVPQEAGAA